MPILVWVAAVRAPGSLTGNPPAAQYAVIALLASALALIVVFFIMAGTRRASKLEAEQEASRWEKFLRPR
jgi:threonine/homoserine/homoserine lactone efflux protein